MLLKAGGRRFDLARLAGWSDVTVLAGPLVFACLLVPLLVVEAALRTGTRVTRTPRPGKSP